MKYSTKYCQGDCVNLRPCCPPPFCQPYIPPCPNYTRERTCCQTNNDLTMFLIGYMIGQNSQR